MREGLRVERPGLWRYGAALPAVQPVWLGEGGTPLIASRRWPGVWWKDEGLNPTGSVWARGAAVALGVARSRAVGAVRFEGGSDACAAVSAYAAGLGVSVQVRGELTAADQVVVASVSRGDGAEAAGEELEALAWAAGMGTLALEVVEQLGWRMPAAVVWGGAGEEDLRALRGGFEQAVKLGWVAGTVPECLGAEESEGWAEVVRAVLAGDGVLLSRAGAYGAAAALARGGEVVVVNGRSGLKEGEELARWLGVRTLPGRVPVGGIITPA